MRQKISTGNRGTPSCFLSKSFFDTRNLPKHSCVLLRISSTLWDEKFLIEYRDNTFYVKQFPMPGTLSNTDWFPHAYVWQCEIKNRQTCDNPFFRQEIFLYQHFLKHKRVPVRSFLVLQEKKSIKSFYYVLPKTIRVTAKTPKHRRVPLRSFWYYGKKRISQSPDAPPSNPKAFLIPETVWNHGGLSHKSSVTATRRFQLKNVMTPPALLPIQ